MHVLRKTSVIIVILTLIVLLFPLIAMQFTNEVNWTISDFIVMGFLLLTVGFTCNFVIKNIEKPSIRFIILAAILFLFILVVAELAVGIID